MYPIDSWNEITFFPNISQIMYKKIYIIETSVDMQFNSSIGAIYLCFKQHIVC